MSKGKGISCWERDYEVKKHRAATHRVCLPFYDESLNSVLENTIEEELITTILRIPRR